MDCASAYSSEVINVWMVDDNYLNDSLKHIYATNIPHLLSMQSTIFNLISFQMIVINNRNWAKLLSIIFN